MILPILQAIIFVSYVTFLLIRFKGPIKSISESWYALGYPTNILFILFCFSLGLTLTFYPESVLFFIGGTALSLVGVACAFKSSEKLTNIIHFGGATIAIVSSLIGIGLAFDTFIPLVIWVGGTLPMMLFKIKNHIWWVEILAFLTIIVGLLIR